MFPEYTIGADPEIALEYRGNFIDASFVIDEARTIDFKAKGNDKKLIDFVCGTVGLDGNESIAEIRPHYSTTPLGLVQNIQKTIVQACEDYPHLAASKWLAGSNKHGHHIGGHIHFGVDMAQAMESNIPMALDIYLAPMLMMFENATEAKKRKEEFGSLSDIRQQPWGFEYRTPASWISTPGTSLAALSLAKHIVNQAVKNPHFFAELTYLDVFNTDMWMLREKYDDHNTTFFRKFLAPLWTEILSWQAEEGLETGIQIMRKMIENKVKYKNEDIKKGWGVHVSFS